MQSEFSKDFGPGALRRIRDPKMSQNLEKNETQS